jgi:hypothetical protein
VLVVLDHARAHDVLFRASFVDGLLDVLLLGMRPDVDGGRVESEEEWLVPLRVGVHPFHRFAENLAVERLHALARELEPMSSPKMTTMLGLCAVWADAAAANDDNATQIASVRRQ